MAHLALYRKHRSQTFQDVCGQEHVTRTLQNAIKQGRIGHAYLFCGPRGTGKTTTARLLAKALCCETGPVAEPCNTCNACISITEGRAVDVVEMDAASETGIDDVRQTIIENAAYMPQYLRYKVYIIDEVHDLSAKAFDALLKTLEEPPSHVVFVLATTEFNRVPITIRSRCLRFDFKRGTVDSITQRLSEVLAREGAEAEPEALDVIARAADGSYRDSLSLLEQVMAYTEGPLRASTAREVLGLVDDEAVGQVINALVRRDGVRVLRAMDAIFDSGFTPRLVVEALTARFRALYYAKAGVFEDKLTPGEREALKMQAALFPEGALPQYLAQCMDTLSSLKVAVDPRLMVDLLAIRLVETGGVPSQPSAQSDRPRTSNTTVTQQSMRDVTIEQQAPSAATFSGSKAAPEPAPAAVTTPSDTDAAPGDISTQSGVIRAGETIADAVRRRWPAIINAIKRRSPSGAALLQQAQIGAMRGNAVEMLFANKFAADRMADIKKRQFVEQIIASDLGIPSVQLVCDVATNGPESFIDEVESMFDGKRQNE